MFDIYKNKYYVVFDAPELEVHKANLQLLAFELGFSWASGHTEVLYTSSGDMKLLCFNTSKTKELTRSSLVDGFSTGSEEVSITYLKNKFKELLGNA